MRITLFLLHLSAYCQGDQKLLEDIIWFLRPPLGSVSDVKRIGSGPSFSEIGCEEDCALDGGGESGRCNIGGMCWAEGDRGVDIDKEEVRDEADETVIVLNWDWPDESDPVLYERNSTDLLRSIKLILFTSFFSPAGCSMSRWYSRMLGHFRPWPPSWTDWHTWLRSHAGIDGWITTVSSLSK